METERIENIEITESIENKTEIENIEEKEKKDLLLKKYMNF